MTEAILAKPEQIRSSDSSGIADASRRVLDDNRDTPPVTARTVAGPEPTHLEMTNPYPKSGDDKNAPGTQETPPDESESWFDSAVSWTEGALDVAEQVVVGAAESAYTQITENPGETLLHLAEGVAIGVAIVAAAPIVGALGAGAAVVGGVALAADAVIVGLGVAGAISAGAEVVDAANNASASADVLMHKDQHTAAEIAAAREEVQDKTGAAAVDAGVAILGVVGGVASGAKVISAGRAAMEGTVGTISTTTEAIAGRVGGKVSTAVEGAEAAETTALKARAEAKPNPYSEHFTPEQLAKIEEMQKTQDSMPVTKLTPAEQTALVEEIYGAGAEVKGKRLDIVIGAPGSGKSSLIAEPLAKSNGSMIVDADLAKPKINGYADGLGADAVHQASSKVAAELLELGFQNGDNMVSLKLGRTEAGLIPLIERAKLAGYEVNLHCAELPLSESVLRVFRRAFPQDGTIGQWVNPTFAVDVGIEPILTFEALIKRPDLIDNFSHFNTNVPYKSPPILIQEGTTQLRKAA